MARKRLSKHSRRKIAIIAILAILIAALGLWYVNYRATKRLGFDLATRAPEVIARPQFMFSFSGGSQMRLQRPLGVLALDDRVYVTDSQGRKVFVFSPDGKYIKTFGADKLKTPLYIARNPKDGNLYVSDRRTKKVEVFTTDGAWVKTFDPKLPASELATGFDTKGDVWNPVAMAFGPDGTFYVTEILNGHRLLIFSPEGTFQKSIGTAGIVLKAAEAKEVFQFPNSIKVHGEEVWVADSNNRRIQIFDRKGTFKRVLVTSGLPRGIDFLPASRKPSAKSPDLFVVVDTLAHDATIWNVNGAELVGFGGQGVLDGQFSYPNDVSVGPKSMIYITDTSNGRVQVWGWPEEVSPIPLPRTVQQWMWCLSPLLLLPLLLFFRKVTFFATADFVEAMLVAELAYAMPSRRRRWAVTEEVYEQLKDRSEGDLRMSELLEPIEYSDADARALVDKLEIDYAEAVTMSIAQRARVFCTESTDLRRIARTLEVDVVNRQEFLDRFAEGKVPPSDTPPTDDPTPSTEGDAATGARTSDEET